MPKVNIREIDRTGNDTLEYLNYTVLIPGPKLGFWTIDEDSADKFEEFVVKPKTIFTLPSDLPDNLEPCKANGDPVFPRGEFHKADYINDIGFLMLRELLSKGLSVKYVPAYTVDENYDITPIVNETFFRDYSDKGKFDLRFITLGGLSKLPSEDLAEFAKEALMCAGNRGDSVALLDVPEKATSGSDSEEIDLNTTALIDDWVQDNFGFLAATSILPEYRNGVQDKADESETYGRYGAIFSPWLIFKFGKDYKKVPSSFNYLACFAKYIQRFKSWFSVSGSIRGVSPYSGIIPTLDFGDADINVLQVRDGGKDNINEGHVATDVICNIRPYGNIVWGNRTMHPLGRPNNDTGDAAIQLTASSFLNIRQLCIDIKKTLYRAARRFTFEPNSDVLWVNFKGAITPLLEEMKANQGIKGYQIVPVPTKKKALLVAKIKIVPIEAVEDFDLTVELNDSIEVTE